MASLSRETDWVAGLAERDPAKPAFVAYARVRFSDLDPLGHVNNAVYVTYLEQAAIDHAAALDLGQDRLAELGGVFIARRHLIDFLKPAVADDRLQIVTWIGEMRGARAVRFYEIERRAGDAITDWPRSDRRLTANDTIAGFGDLILRARTDWAYVDPVSGRPRRMPPEVLAVFPPESHPRR
jgi:acyl-CoA thioester hydrolase